MDPVNFDLVVNHLDQVNDLGLGHVSAPQVINLDIAMNVVISQEEGREDFFHRGNVSHEGRVFTWDVHLEDIDCCANLDHNGCMIFLATSNIFQVIQQVECILVSMYICMLSN